MKTCYVGHLGAIADLVSPGELTINWTITRINVPKSLRERKLGSRLLDRICNDADNEQVALQLEISQSDGLTFDQLERWYASRGFSRLVTGYYQRLPRRGSDDVQPETACQA